MSHKSETTPGNITSEAPGLNKDSIDRVNQVVDEIVVESGRIPSPSEDALLDFGKSLIQDSVAQSLEFHKTMLGLTTTFATLMASGFSVLAFGSKNQQLGKPERLFLVVPVILMLLSSVCFTSGYYPRQVKLRLRMLSTIKEARNKLMRTRRMWAFLGVLLFTLSVLSLLAGIVFFNI